MSDDTTIYGILPGRGYKQAVQLLGEDFDAFLIHDGWSIYYQFLHAYHQSCNRHLINRCDLLLENATPATAVFPRNVKVILLKGLDLRDEFSFRSGCAALCSLPCQKSRRIFSSNCRAS